jgi:GNAT superfamily N-acetyltransferase
MEHEKIRLATLDDAEAMHALHTISVRTLCKNAYPPEVIDGWLLNRSPSGYKGINRNEMYVAELNETIVGFSHIVPGEIVAIFVHPDHVRKGIGSALMHYGITKAKINHKGPIKIEATLNAQPFYETVGFQKTGDRITRRNDVDIPIVEMELKET